MLYDSYLSKKITKVECCFVVYFKANIFIFVLYNKSKFLHLINYLYHSMIAFMHSKRCIHILETYSHKNVLIIHV